MSQFLQAMLVRDVKPATLKSYFKKRKNDGFLKKVGSNVVAVALHDLEDRGEEVSQQVSADLQARTMLLIHNEDYGWIAYGYDLGFRTFALTIQYEEPEEAVSLSGGVEAWIVDPAEWAELKRVLDSREEESIFENSWGLFANALRIEIDDHFSYPFLKEHVEDGGAAYGIEVFPERKSSFKKLLKAHLEPKMAERGFLPNTTTPLPGDYHYSKYVYGKEVGLRITKDDNHLIPVLRTLYGSAYLFDELYKKSFSNDEDLLCLLEETVALFDEKLEKFRHELFIKPFDYRQVFLMGMESYMLSKGYDLESCSMDDLATGDAMYRDGKNRLKVRFKYSPFYLSIDCDLLRGNKKETVVLKDEAGNWISNTFRNKEEYAQVLECYKTSLEKLNI